MVERDRKALGDIFRDLGAWIWPPKPKLVLAPRAVSQPQAVVSPKLPPAPTLATPDKLDARPFPGQPGSGYGPLTQAPLVPETPKEAPDLSQDAKKSVPLGAEQGTPTPAPPTIAPPPVISIPALDGGIPDEAIDFVVVEEDGSQAYYNTHYTHWDWPEGASGPTIGVGYDCGYVTPAEARADWSGYVDQGMLNSIEAACGRRGEAAAAWVSEHRNSVTIPYALGLKQFKEKVMPTWVATCRKYIPNYDDMPPLMRGALFSLVYNRGPGGFVTPGSRNAEMREIAAAARAKNFTAIPDLIASQKRLWPKGGDLWNRRLHEAALATKGLKEAGIIK
jgi:hypothetical protein